MQLNGIAHIQLTVTDVARSKQFYKPLLALFEMQVLIDTEGEKPTSHALLEKGLEGEHSLREDETRPGLDRERLLERAPDAGDGLFKVPRVLP